MIDFMRLGYQCEKIAKNGVRIERYEKGLWITLKDKSKISIDGNDILFVYMMDKEGHGIAHAAFQHGTIATVDYFGFPCLKIQSENGDMRIVLA